MKRRGDDFWSSMVGHFGPLLALLLVFLFFAAVDASQPNGGRFLSLLSLQTMLISPAPVFVAALGMTVIIIAGGIDLSVGTAVALCATVMAWILDHGGPIELALLGSVLTGCATGSVNGALISALRVAPFIV